MSAPRGIWLNEHRFHQFAELQPADAAGSMEHIASRARAGDYSAFFGLLPNPDPVLRRMGKSLDVYRDLAGDAHVKGCLRRRRGSVKAMERGFERGQAPARVARDLEAIFADLPMSRIVEQAVAGADYGYQPFEVLWGRVGRYLVPVDVVAKPPEWFGFDADNQLRFRAMGAQIMGEALPPMRFLLSRNNPSYLNPYGESDLASAFWPTTFKRGGLKFWVTFTEKYGTPWAIGKQPRTADPGSANKLLDQLEAMVRDAVAVIPDDSSVELLTVSTQANAELFERLLHFCRSEVSIALLGNNQTVEATANLASAKAAQAVEADLRDAMAEMVAESINTLVGWITSVNWGEGTRAPTYKLWEQEEVDEKLARRDQTLVQAGAKLTRAYFMAAYSLREEDLAPDAAAGAPPAAAPASLPAPAATEFAEGEPTEPDQAALDAAVAALPADELSAAMRELLQPALDAIAGQASLDGVREALLDAYPRMPVDRLERLLHQAFFVADVWGTANADQP